MEWVQGILSVVFWLAAVAAQICIQERMEWRSDTEFLESGQQI